MSQNQYQAQQLATLLEAIQNKQASGVLYLDAEINPARKLRSRVLVWKEGRLMYGGTMVPDPHSLVKTLEQKLSREWVSSAVASLCCRTNGLGHDAGAVRQAHVARASLTKDAFGRPAVQD